ncbi:hypothetical protein AX17_001985 [Amanita inopinata Kibby_2008]|nr:hypothetical protein AX17_001985 [Amanita inopinata Kibby_2008]
MASPNLHAISPALFFLIPLFLLILAFQPNPVHRPAAVLLAHSILTLISILALLAAALGLAATTSIAVSKAEAIVKALFVFSLEGLLLYLIRILSSYRLYVNALFAILSIATLLSFLSNLLSVHYHVPSAISPTLLVLFSLVSFPLLSYLIFPSTKVDAPREFGHNQSPSQIPLNGPCHLAKSSLSISFVLPSPAASTATIGTNSTATYTTISPCERKLNRMPQEQFYDVDLENTALSGVPDYKPRACSPRQTSRIFVFLFIAQFFFLFSSVLSLIESASTSDTEHLWTLKTIQSALLVASTFFTTFAHSQYVRSFFHDHDRDPLQASETYDSSISTTCSAKSVYPNSDSNQMIDRAHTVFKAKSQATCTPLVVQSESNTLPSTTTNFPLSATDSSFTLDSHQIGTSGTLDTSCIEAPAFNDATARSRHNHPATVTALPRIIGKKEMLVVPNSNQVSVVASPEVWEDEMYLPAQFPVSSPSQSRHGVAVAAIADPLSNIQSSPISNVDSTIHGERFGVQSKRASTLVHRESFLSISSSLSSSSVLSSIQEIPVSMSTIPTLSSSSSSLMLSASGGRANSGKSQASLNRLPLSKCVPLHVLSRNMVVDEVGTLQFSEATKISNRGDQQSLSRVDERIGSRSGSMSAASLFTEYGELEAMPSSPILPDLKVASQYRETQSQGRFRLESLKSALNQGCARNQSTHPSGVPRHPGLSVSKLMRARSLSSSLLNSLTNRHQKEEESSEPVSPSTSLMSFSSTSVLSPFSWTRSRSPATRSIVNKVEDGSGRSRSESESAVGKKKKKEKQQTQRHRKDKKQQPEQALSPVDFMDMHDPFAPPNLGTCIKAASTTSLHRYGYEGEDVSYDVGAEWGCEQRYGVGKTGTGKSMQRMSMWGRLPLSANPPPLARPKVRDSSSLSSLDSPSRGKGKTAYQHQVGTQRKSRITTRKNKGGSAGNADGQLWVDHSPLTRHEQTRDSATNTAVVSSGGRHPGTVARGKEARRPSPRFTLDHDGFDVEEALLAQRLLMRLDLASHMNVPSSTEIKD